MTKNWRELRADLVWHGSVYSGPIDAEHDDWDYAARIDVINAERAAKRRAEREAAA